MACGLTWKTCDCPWFDCESQDDSTVASVVTRRSPSREHFYLESHRRRERRWPPRTKKGVKLMTQLGQKDNSSFQPLSTTDDDESNEEGCSSGSETITSRQPKSEVSGEIEQTTVAGIRGLFRRRPSNGSLVETRTTRDIPEVSLKTRLKQFSFKGWGKGGN
jgi:hypothetical protein